LSAAQDNATNLLAALGVRSAQLHDAAIELVQVNVTDAQQVVARVQPLDEATGTLEGRAAAAVSEALSAAELVKATQTELQRLVSQVTV
jgi:hypothetical protein